MSKVQHEVRWLPMLGTSMCILIGTLAFLNSCLHAQAPKQFQLQSGNHSVTCERFSAPALESPTLILLHGTSGPDSPFYRGQAVYYAQHGYSVLMPHYFDATGGSTNVSDESYRKWAAVVKDLLRSQGIPGSLTSSKVVLVGYSLGASIALAAGSQGLDVQGIAEWYGSLPDSFFYNFRSMPPLLILHGQRDTNIPVLNAQQLIRLCTLKQLACESHLYPDQAHGFSDAALSDAQQRTLGFFIQHLR